MLGETHSDTKLLVQKESHAICEADHQHLNPASLMAKETGPACVCCADALGLRW